LNDPCFSTLTNSSGTCVDPDNCEAFNETTKFKMNICAFNQKLPIVCCPIIQRARIMKQELKLPQLKLNDRCFSTLANSTGLCVHQDDCEAYRSCGSQLNVCGEQGQSLVCCPTGEEKIELFLQPNSEKCKFPIHVAC